MIPRLRILNGDVLGESFDLAGPSATVGRAEDNDIVLDDDRVSRHHFRIRFEKGGPLLEDLGSSNGTYVNDLPVTARRLFDGDEIRLGNHRLSFAFSEG
ncbi:MAG: FHA domain-containing protein, partial [Planctomycetota bacterium]